MFWKRALALVPSLPASHDWLPGLQPGALLQILQICAMARRESREQESWVWGKAFFLARQASARDERESAAGEMLSLSSSSSSSSQSSSPFPTAPAAAALVSLSLFSHHDDDRRRVLLPPRGRDGKERREREGPVFPRSFCRRLTQQQPFQFVFAYSFLEQEFVEQFSCVAAFLLL